MYQLYFQKHQKLTIRKLAKVFEYNRPKVQFKATPVVFDENTRVGDTVTVVRSELDKVEYNQPDGSFLTCALYSVGSDRAFLDIYRQSHGELIRANIYKVVQW